MSVFYPPKDLIEMPHYTLAKFVNSRIFTIKPLTISVIKVTTRVMVCDRAATHKWLIVNISIANDNTAEGGDDTSTFPPYLGPEIRMCIVLQKE